MLILKLIGGAAIVGGGIAFSKLLFYEDDRRIERVKALIELVYFIRSGIEGFCLPISDILAEADGEIFSRMGYHERQKPNELEQIIVNSAFSSDPAIINALREFASSLGNGYRQEEIRRCDAFASELSRVVEKRSAEREQKKKTVPVLTFAISFGIAVLLF